MKHTAIVLLLMLLTGCTTDRVSTPAMSSSQQRLCDKFKQMKWMDRSDVGQAVVQILRGQGLVGQMSDTRSLHRDQIVSILGEPDYRTRERLEYFLNRKGAEDYMLVFELRHDHAISVSTAVVMH